MTKATILHLQRLSTEDGPGIRTTVFFKGCPLRCAWCHNPESLSPRPQVQWLEGRCIGCRTCLEACPRQALRHSQAGVAIKRDECDGCGACAAACPSGALELLGRQVSVGELLAELLKDRAYYERSGGGVTASGGEPALQVDFTAELFTRLRAAGIATALDTCGLCSRSTLERLLPLSDLVLFDLKEIDAACHRQFTGQDNALILENFRRVMEFRPAQRVWVRTPLIPDTTDTRANLRGLGALLAQYAGRIERWELCAFNNLCRDKYRRLGLEWAYAEAPLMRQTELDEALGWARESGIDPALVSLTGAARVEK